MARRDCPYESAPRSVRKLDRAATQPFTARLQDECAVRAPETIARGMSNSVEPCYTRAGGSANGATATEFLGGTGYDIMELP